MAIKVEKFIISTSGFDEIIDITQKIKNISSLINSNNALITISANSNSCSIAITKDPSSIIDLSKTLDDVIYDRIYKDSEIQNKNYSELKALLFNKSASVIMNNSKLELNDKQIMLINFDSQKQDCEIIVSINY